MRFYIPEVIKINQAANLIASDDILATLAIIDKARCGEVRGKIRTGFGNLWDFNPVRLPAKIE